MLQPNQEHQLKPLNKTTIAESFQSIQDEICAALVLEDGKGQFKEEIWEREGGGGGRTRILQEGNVIEKGGVNFSAVHGTLPDSMVKALQVNDNQFFATGVSIVLHPFSPLVPIIHMNIRYFELSDGTHWFGGGIDLTPHYIVAEDARFFHQQLQQTCDQFDASYYPKFKDWADQYFYIPHRKETRGIGGIFFDKLSASSELEKKKLFDFTTAVGRTFAPTYCALMAKNKVLSYTEDEKKWQYVRRSRYVEFNLVYDKGTRFGLETDGRTESILMSLPPQANWVYDYQAQPGSAEEYTLQHLKKGITWLEQ